MDKIITNSKMPIALKPTNRLLITMLLTITLVSATLNIVVQLSQLDNHSQMEKLDKKTTIQFEKESSLDVNPLLHDEDKPGGHLSSERFDDMLNALRGAAQLKLMSPTDKLKLKKSFSIVDEDSVQIFKSKSLKVPQLTEEYNVTSHQLVIDAVSMGSSGRFGNMAAQQKTWGMHPTIRDFFVVTEFDSSCNSSFLVNRSHCLRYMGRNSSKLPYTRALPYTHYPAGWWCAQTHIVQGLERVLAQMKLVNLPDWVLVVDDDTYFDLDMVLDQIRSHNPDDSKLIATFRFSSEGHSVSETR
jgi:hypothetical protein